ncbi:uncharacterized protein [Amphiura filiformis]|uniref:uncharacterized protein n=1 Tax=Amphiura filiformis TaxID=82378 RepID=UPI003B2202E9
MEESSSASLSSACSMNVTQNPFDTDSLDSLHLPQCSPSVFAIKQKSTPASSVKKTPKFRWSIDQMAILHPVEIEELPYQQEDSKLDADTEEKIQAAIDKFFSQQQIIPSPWSEPKPFPRIPMSPAPTPPSGADESNHTKDVVPKPKPKTANATCQTMLTLPMDFDLEALLGSEHFQYKEHNKSDCEIMSSSSLRRKLFSCDTTPPVSPVKSGGCRTSPVSSRESMPFIISSPAISPIRAVEEAKSASPSQSMMKTPGSAQSQFSSSPIASNVTPTSRLSSSDPTELVSPCMSPIGKSNITTPLSSTAASEPTDYTKSNFNGASLPDDSSISMSIMESPIRQSSIMRTDFGSKSCASPFHHAAQDKMYESSLETWSTDLYNCASQKLSSTMNPEPVDALGLTFEPKMCSSRLIISAIQESKVHTPDIPEKSDCGRTGSKATTDEHRLYNSRPDSRNSSHTVDEYRKDYMDVHQRVPPRLPFGQSQKPVTMDEDSDSGFNTGNVSAFEPTDMEVVEGR